MFINVLDSDTRERISSVQKFISLIWTERFASSGDFELQLLPTKENLDLFKIDRYIEIYNSNNLMIIESIEIKNSNTFIIKGRSLESLLERRVQMAASEEKEKDILKIISKLIRLNFHDYSIPYRRVEYIKEGDHRIENLDNKYIPLNQYTISMGSSVYDIVTELTSFTNIGFKFIFNKSDKNFYFVVYDSVEKSIIIDEAQYMLTESDYIESVKDFKTTILVAGEGEDEQRKKILVSRVTKSGNNSKIEYEGIFRREMYTDARDVQKEDKESAQSYTDRLKERGIIKINEKNKSYDVDGKIFEYGRYQLNRDFVLGDILTIRTKYFSAKVRVTEVIQSWDSSGYSIYPTFAIVQISNAEVEESFNIE